MLKVWPNYVKRYLNNSKKYVNMLTIKLLMLYYTNGKVLRNDAQNFYYSSEALENNLLFFQFSFVGVACIKINFEF